MAHPFMSDLSEAIWFDKWRCDDAERSYQEKKAGCNPQSDDVPSKTSTKSSLVSEIAKARQHIQNSLKTDDVPVATIDNTVLNRLETLEQENKELRKVTDDLRQLIKNMENRISTLEGKKSAPAPAPAKPAAAEEEDDDEDDDDFELFGSDDEDDKAAAEKLKQERVAAYNAKKAKKAPLIAKSNIILDVKPWDDETDMKEMEKCVRTIEMDGLLWGASKLVPLAYGIKKLQICCVVEDDKVGTDDLEEQILAFEDFIQSVDIAAFNKI